MRTRKTRMPSEPCGGKRSSLAAGGGAQPRRNQVVVMGMSRSGTSLTTSIVAAVLGGPARPAATWRGTGPAYPRDSRTSAAGYFERQDLVSLNYATLRQLGLSWTRFPPNYAEHPKVQGWGRHNNSDVRRRFEARAASIIEDMSSSRTPYPWVLKDVRFARTLPLWSPMLSQPVCIIPYRHPVEVASSSIMGSVSLWESYNVAALTSARAVGCPTLLLPYDGWMQPEAAAAQLQTLLDFLSCAGVGGLAPQSPAAVLNSTIFSGARHQHAERASPRVKSQLSESARCLWRRLNSGAALLDPSSHACGGVRRTGSRTGRTNGRRTGLFG